MTSPHDKKVIWLGPSRSSRDTLSSSPLSVDFRRILVQYALSRAASNQVLEGSRGVRYGSRHSTQVYSRNRSKSKFQIRHCHQIHNAQLSDGQPSDAVQIRANKK